MKPKTKAETVKPNEAVASTDPMWKTKLLADCLKSESLVASLKSQLAMLKTSPGGATANEEARLKAENEKLKLKVAQLKDELIKAEVDAGIKQYSSPQPSGEVTVNPPTATTKPLGTDNISKEEVKPEKTEKVKKEKAEIVKPPKKAAAPAAENTSAELDVSRLDMRIGLIVNAKKHPDAEKLYVEEVDLGEGQNRTVISGLAEHIPLDKMQNRLAVFLCNLKPQKMRGIESQAMVMCASTPEKVEILDPPTNAAIGDRVTCEGFEGAPDPVLVPKKKIWESIQPDMRVNSTKIGCWKNLPLQILGKGYVTAPTLTDVHIK